MTERYFLKETRIALGTLLMMAPALLGACSNQEQTATPTPELAKINEPGLSISIDVKAIIPMDEIVLPQELEFDNESK